MTIDEVRLSPLMVQEAIKQSKSKAIEPNQIARIHLHYVGPKGMVFLTHLINLSLSTCVIAQNWKVGKIIPLLKPVKDPEHSKSYRPYALLSPVAKITERLLLPKFDLNIP